MYNRLYFYAVGQDYLDLVDQLLFHEISALPTYPNGNSDLLPGYKSIDRGRFLSLKKREDVRVPRKSNMLFSEATYDVVSWARGYIHEDRQLVGHMIQQTLPRFKKPNPTSLDLEKFEDAKALRKVISALRRWMNKNWTDHYGNGGFFGPEALRLKVEEGYETGSIELDNIPSTVYILPK